MMQKNLGFGKMMLLGHSMGAFSSSMFAACFPDAVHFLVCFDFFKPLQLESRVENRSFMIDSFIKYNDQLSGTEEPPSYTMDQLVVLWREGSLQSVDLDCCRYILERSVAPSKTDEKKFYLTRDPRLKLESFLNYDRKDLGKAYGKIDVPMFISKGKDSVLYEREEYTKEMLEIVKKSSKDCQYYVVNGTHHHHLNNPDVLQDKLVKFLNKYYVLDSDVDLLRKHVKILSV